VPKPLAARGNFHPDRLSGRHRRQLEDVEAVRILGSAKETMGVEAGEGSTFAHA
jgi:hypothetical protein